MIRTYEDRLQTEGIAETRTEEIYEAIDNLHRALCKLDINGRRIFFSRTIRERINEFAEIEQLAKF